VGYSFRKVRYSATRSRIYKNHITVFAIQSSGEHGGSAWQRAHVFLVLDDFKLDSGANEMKGFNSLDLYYKSDILKQQADYLITIDIEECSVKLYSWDRFFIEQYFDAENQVSSITIASGLDMPKYLKTISLADLGYPTVV
jgi:hypothetical protein